MAEDILAELRAKEDEFEALINDSRQKASRIKEEAQRSARDFIEAEALKLDQEIKNRYETEIAAIEAEARRIEEEGVIEAGELRKKGQANFSRTLEEVIIFLKGPAGGNK